MCNFSFHLWNWGILTFEKWMLFLKMIKTHSRLKLEKKECEELSSTNVALLWGHTTDSHSKWNSNKRFIANTPWRLCTWPLTALKCWIDLIDAKNMPRKECNLPPSLFSFPVEETHNQHHEEPLAESISRRHLHPSSWVITLHMCRVIYSYNIFCS